MSNRCRRKNIGFTKALRNWGNHESLAAIFYLKDFMDSVKNPKHLFTNNDIKFINTCYTSAQYYFKKGGKTLWPMTYAMDSYAISLATKIIKLLFRGDPEDIISDYVNCIDVLRKESEDGLPPYREKVNKREIEK